MTFQLTCQEALRSARQQGHAASVHLESGAVLRVAAAPDRFALYRPDQAPEQEEAHRIAAALGWHDPVIESLQGRMPGWLISPRPAPPPPPFLPGLPFPGRHQMRPRTLYHLTHGQTDFTLILREDGQDVHWREVRGPNCGHSWSSFQQHQQSGVA